MAETVDMALAELARDGSSRGSRDLLREAVRVPSQALVEMEVRQNPGAERHERMS